MKMKTLHDVLEWTRVIHQQLSNLAAHHSEEDERISLLLNHISKHEKHMARAIKQFEDSDNINVLNTYCQTFFETKPIKMPTIGDHPFANMDTDDIAAAILKYHKHIIELFEYLQSNSAAPSAEYFLYNVLSFEKSEQRLLARDMNMIRDF